MMLIATLALGFAIGIIAGRSMAYLPGGIPSAPLTVQRAEYPYRTAAHVERIEIECKRRHVDELPRDYNPFAMPQPMTLPPIGPASRVRE